MDVRRALKEQYRGGLAMLAECVEKCPEEMWQAVDAERPFWRIAHHAAFFAHFYLGQTEPAFQPWSVRQTGTDVELWCDPPEPFSRDETLAYIRYIDGLMDPTIDGLDLDSGETGISWYQNMTKLSHELMNLRHLQGHVGQLSEQLMQRGIDTSWIRAAGAGLGRI